MQAKISHHDHEQVVVKIICQIKSVKIKMITNSLKVVNCETIVRNYCLNGLDDKNPGTKRRFIEGTSFSYIESFHHKPCNDYKN